MRHRSKQWVSTANRTTQPRPPYRLGGTDVKVQALTGKPLGLVASTVMASYLSVKVAAQVTVSAQSGGLWANLHHHAVRSATRTWRARQPGSPWHGCFSHQVSYEIPRNGA
jgi:hypothetical protein